MIRIVENEEKSKNMNNNFSFLSFPGNEIAKKLFQDKKLELPITVKVTLKHEIFTKSEAAIGEVDVTLISGNSTENTIYFVGKFTPPLLRKEVEVKGQILLDGTTTGGYLEIINQSDFKELEEQLRLAHVETDSK